MHVDALCEYLKALADNNQRPWFLHNKPTYDILREEFTQLVTEVIQGVARFDKHIAHVDPKKSLFRIYRDVRFSKNKDPYKTHFSAFMTDHDRRTGLPGYYFQVTEKSMLGIGGGHYSPSPEMLARYRQYIVNYPQKLKRALADSRFADTYGALSSEGRLLRPPKGYDPQHPLIDALKNRHFFGFTEISLAQQPPQDLAGCLIEKLHASYPLIAWLRAAGAAP